MDFGKLTRNGTILAAALEVALLLPVLDPVILAEVSVFLLVLVRV